MKQYEGKSYVLAGFGAQQMFDLVNDVAKYPEFLPGCVGAKVLSHSPTQMVAQVEVSKGTITHHFTTEISGKYHELGQWSFFV